MVFFPCFKRIPAASVRKQQQVRNTGTGHNSAPVQLWASAFTALSLNFPINELGITTESTPLGHGVDEMKS